MSPADVLLVVLMALSLCVVAAAPLGDWRTEKETESVRPFSW
ncbi:MAG TPA: hypothetical protein VMX12_04590 [Acidimicrobiia bacterium]|nr:hypothetical protein [Acidimicrobiia bacterium]